MADEHLVAIVELCTTESPSFDGKYVSFDNVPLAPKPVQKHPVESTGRVPDRRYPCVQRPDVSMVGVNS